MNEGEDIVFMSMAELYDTGLVIDVDDTLTGLNFSLGLIDLPFTLDWDGSSTTQPILVQTNDDYTGSGDVISVSYTHLTLPTNDRV